MIGSLATRWADTNVSDFAAWAWASICAHCGGVVCETARDKSYICVIFQLGNVKYGRILVQHLRVNTRNVERFNESVLTSSPEAERKRNHISGRPYPAHHVPVVTFLRLFYNNTLVSFSIKTVSLSTISQAYSAPGGGHDLSRSASFA